ncbi:MAG: NAD(P)H-dependent oxidoreductase [Pseudomonadota bacterium]
MPNVLIIYHSQSSKVRQMADRVAHGVVQEVGVDLRCLEAFDADADDLRWCDGLIIGSPENFGYMAGAIKDFFDRTFYEVLDEQLNLPYALFIGAGNDGTGASREIQRIVNGFPFRLVAEPLIVNSDLTDAYLLDCQELGHAMAAGMSLKIF